MKGENYPLEATPNPLVFHFESVGRLGRIRKAIIFDHLKGPVWNLAFGDRRDDGSIDDATVSNNGDFVRVLATVAQAAFLFSEKWPARRLVVFPVDARRKRLYHAVFERHQAEIEEVFHIFGWRNRQYWPFDPSEDCEFFLLVRKENSSKKGK